MCCEAIPAGSSRPEVQMAVITITSRELDQDASSAKELAQRGPVFITDHGRPAYVLLTIESYRRLTCGNMSLAEALAQTGSADFEFEPPHVGGIFKPPDLE
jgi:PHD/YefM family antitoxin component YafN of YafNO toxin-antitoxin module